jgi:hypothetical protein
MKRFSMRHGLVVVLLMGCGDEQSSLEAVDSVEQAFGPSCGAANPVASFSFKFDYTTPSPAYTQTGCGLGVVVQVNSYANFPCGGGGGSGATGGGGTGGTVSSGTGGGPSSCTTAKTRVAWADVAAKNQTGCEGMYVRGILYSGQGSNPTLIADRSATGTWVNNACVQPSVIFTASEMPPGASYKVAATARFPPDYTTTAKVSIITTN